MHGVVPKEPADRIERAIHVVDTIILALDPVLILDPIFGHGLISPRSIDRRISLCVTAAVLRGTATGPLLVKVVHLGGLEQIANRHIDPFAWTRLPRAPQKLFQEQLL